MTSMTQLALQEVTPSLSGLLDVAETTAYDVVPERDAAVLARRVMALIDEMRNLTGDPEGVTRPANDFHLAKIEAYIEAGRPVEMVLPAFPAKSANPEKTTGILPDLGEVLALKRLEQLCVAIGEVYEGGARMVVCSDGRVFSDLVGVTDEHVSEYGNEIHEIIREYGLTHLDTFDLDDVFPGSMAYDAMRAQLVETSAAPLSEVRERTARDSEARDMFNGIHRFLFEDMTVLHPELSRNKVRNWSKDLTYQVIQRSNAWSTLVEEHFPEAVRLSIHPQPAQSKKIGVRLLPSSSQWRTPWHSAVLFDGVDFRLVRRQEAEQMGARMVRADGRYTYFIAPASSTRGESVVPSTLQ